MAHHTYADSQGLESAADNRPPPPTFQEITGPTSEGFTTYYKVGNSTFQNRSDAERYAREIGAPIPSDQPVDEAPPPADDTPEDSGLPNLPPLPDRTDVNFSGDKSYNLNKWATDFQDKFADIGRSGEVKFNAIKLDNATPEEVSLYDLNRDGKIDVQDIIDIEYLGGIKRVPDSRAQAATERLVAINTEFSYLNPPGEFPK